MFKSKCKIISTMQSSFEDYAGNLFFFASKKKNLKSVLKRLEQNLESFKVYDQVIRDQLLNNMIEKVSENQSENAKEFFLPHRPVSWPRGAIVKFENKN